MMLQAPPTCARGRVPRPGACQHGACSRLHCVAAQRQAEGQETRRGSTSNGALGTDGDVLLLPLLLPPPLLLMLLCR